MTLALVLIGFVLTALTINATFATKKQIKQGWKTYREGKEAHFYAELIEGNWRSIQFDSEWYSKNAPRHILYIKKDWSSYPDWAQDRKEIIIDRLHQKFKPPTFTIIEVE